MPNGGSLRVAVAHERLEASSVLNLKPGAYIRISVIDSGTGMDAETLAKATEPFFSTKGIGKGTGLGLSMVDGLVRQLGGAMTIGSAPGKGTQVHLLLPVSAEQPVAAQALVPEGGAAKATGLVLLVDDEPLVRMSTADMLTELGYDVVEADTALEALRMIRHGLRPDLVVTDHLMPGMTGIDLARALDEECPDVPALIISGYADGHGIAPGFARLAKPFLKDELSASLALLRA
jgi:CheY-like chemotaxis protein